MHALRPSRRGQALSGAASALSVQEQGLLPVLLVDGHGNRCRVVHPPVPVGERLVQLQPRVGVGGGAEQPEAVAADRAQLPAGRTSSSTARSRSTPPSSRCAGLSVYFGHESGRYPLEQGAPTGHRGVRGASSPRWASSAGRVPGRRRTRSTSRASRGRRGSRRSRGPSAASSTSAQVLRIPRHEEEPRDHGVAAAHGACGSTTPARSWCRWQTRLHPRVLTSPSQDHYSPAP